MLGPGTVGLDGSLSAEEVAYTALEALEYYGVYAISRAYDPTLFTTTDTTTGTSMSSNGTTGNTATTSSSGTTTTIPTTHQEEEVVHTLDPNALSPMSQHTVLTTTQKHRQKRRSSLAFRLQSTRLKSGELFGSDDPENNNPQYIYEPELSEETIINRRISMGVYEMFSKL